MNEIVAVNHLEFETYERSLQIETNTRPMKLNVLKGVFCNMNIEHRSAQLSVDAFVFFAAVIVVRHSIM